MASPKTETVIPIELVKLKNRVAFIRENREKSYQCGLERERIEKQRAALRQKVAALKAEAAEIESGDINPEGIAEAAARLSQIELEVRLTERAAAAIQDPPAFRGYTGAANQNDTLEFITEFTDAQSINRLQQVAEFMRSWGGNTPSPEMRFISWQALSGACPALREAASLKHRLHMGPAPERVFEELLTLIENA